VASRVIRAYGSVDAGSWPRILHGIGEEGGGADLTSKLVASRQPGLPGTPSSPTPVKVWDRKPRYKAAQRYTSRR
jgi:hypothetical protein